jgi:hypothetical protein
VIRLRFVPRAELAPAGHWLASKRGDETVADVGSPVVGPPLTPLLDRERDAIARPFMPVALPVFRFSFKLVITPKIETLDDVPIYQSDAYDLLDQWDGDPGRACRDLEDTLQRLVLRPGRRVIVSGGYV